MNVWQAGLALVLAFGTTLAQAATDRGTYTLVEGDARVLRGTTWFKLAAGARAEEGDIVDAGERGQVQLELARGGTLNVQGPAVVHAVALPAADDKGVAPAELALPRGWFKAAVPAKARPLRLRLSAATLDIASGIVVVHDDPALVEVFIERGSASVAGAAPHGKDAAREAHEGEFWQRSGERAFVTDERPPSAFIAAMPRDLRDPLPSLASRHPTPAPPLAVGREITFAEAEPWLAGSSRKSFTRRFAPRLADPAFRAAAAAARPIPEWDRVLHPERYRPKSDEVTQDGADARK